MDSRVEGSVIAVRPRHCIKALLPMLVMPSPNVIDVSDLKP